MNAMDHVQSKSRPKGIIMTHKGSYFDKYQKNEIHLLYQLFI